MQHSVFLFLHRFHAILILMKQILGVFSAFVFIIIAGTVCGAFIFNLYAQCTGYVAGTTVPLVSMPMFQTGILYALPFSILFSPLFLTLYLIRHPSKMPAVIVFYVLETIACFIFLPFSVKALDFSDGIIREKKAVSTGYFRKSGNYLYFYTLVDEHSEADSGKTDERSSVGHSVKVSGVRFRLDESSVDSKKTEIFENVSESLIKKEDFQDFDASQKKNYGGELFADSLAAEVLTPPMLLKGFQEILMMPVFIAEKFESLSDYLALVSMGLALIFVYPLKNFSRWKLGSTLCAILSSLFVLSVNALNYRYSDLWPAASAVLQKIPLPFPLIFYLNIFFCLVSAVVALIVFFRRRGELS